jgi:hypothetical protein
MKTYACHLALLASVLAACSSPSPEFFSSEPQRAAVGSRVFDVYLNGTAAQAVRINQDWGAKPEDVFSDAISAIERVSACSVKKESVTGDLGVIDAKLACQAK